MMKRRKTKLSKAATLRGLPARPAMGDGCWVGPLGQAVDGIYYVHIGDRQWAPVTLCTWAEVQWAERVRMARGGV